MSGFNFFKFWKEKVSYIGRSYMVSIWDRVDHKKPTLDNITGYNLRWALEQRVNVQPLYTESLH